MVVYELMAAELDRDVHTACQISFSLQLDVIMLAPFTFPTLPVLTILLTPRHMVQLSRLFQLLLILGRGCHPGIAMNLFLRV